MFEREGTEPLPFHSIMCFPRYGGKRMFAGIRRRLGWTSKGRLSKALAQIESKVTVRTVSHKRKRKDI